MLSFDFHGSRRIAKGDPHRTRIAQARCGLRDGRKALRAAGHGVWRLPHARLPTPPESVLLTSDLDDVMLANAKHGK